jgi:hypothetical protein
VTLALATTTSAPARAQSIPQESSIDRTALLDLEQRWLAAHDSTTLDRILASDFRHLVPQGVTLDKAAQISWAVRHPPAAGTTHMLHDMVVRIYGDAAVVNGEVCATDPARAVTRTVFTDVFIKRAGRWQAVNAQENAAIGKGSC